MHAGDYVQRGKPNPEVYIETSRLLESEPCDCVVIEDSKSGIIAAKAAEMKVIGLLNGRNRKEDLVTADHIAESYEEITVALIESL